jgi:hypothetical protein
MIESKINRKLSELPIEELAFSTDFVKSHSFKISGEAFILGFFQMILAGFNTLEKWAGQICRITGMDICPQAIQDKLQFRQVKFSKKLLSEVLKRQLWDKSYFAKASKLLESFEKVLVEDSTCITLPKKLYAFFPGTLNQKGKGSSARVQLRLELKSSTFVRIELKSYRDNDQSFAFDIIKNLQKGDLVIRDLGYYVLAALKLVIKKEAFFLSRFRYDTCIYDEQTSEVIDMYKELRRLRNKGVSIFDRKVLLGKREKLPVRLVAIKAPQDVEQQRKRKMRKDLAQKRSKQYWEMLGWTIFITNVSKEIWKPKHLLEAYGYRWRIEIIFKCWKSNFKFTQLFKNKTSLSPPRVYITFYLLLTWLTLFFVNWFSFILIRVYKAKEKILSMFKFAEYLKSNFSKIQSKLELLKDIEFLSKYCVQTKRKTKSQLEMIYMLNTS